VDRPDRPTSSAQRSGASTQGPTPPPEPFDEHGPTDDHEPPADYDEPAGHEHNSAPDDEAYTGSYDDGDEPMDDYDGGSRHAQERPTTPRWAQVPWNMRVKPAVPHQDEELRKEIVTHLRGVLLNQQGRQPGEMLSAIAEIRASGDVLAVLSEEDRLTWAGVLEVLELAAAGLDDASVDLTYLPYAAAYSSDVRHQVTILSKTAGAGPGQGGARQGWNALVEICARKATHQAVDDLTAALDAGAPVETLTRLHEAIPSPTRRALSTTDRPLFRSGQDWAIDAEALDGTDVSLRFSSGWATLDHASTNADKGEMVGFLGQGTLTAIASGSGEGKSSVAGTLVPSVARDMIHLGLENGKVMLAHTEEDPRTKAAEMGLMRGARNHDIGSNILIVPTMSDRKTAARAIYQSFADAIRAADRAGEDPTNFAVQAYFVDYIQQWKDNDDANPAAAVARSADFLLNGVASCSPEEMEKFSGVGFTATTGMRWPDELRDHRIAVAAFAQLIKFDPDKLNYNPHQKSHQVDQYVVCDENGQPYWDLKPGDRRIPDKADIRGGGEFVQHCHNIIMLSRSKVEGNAVVPGPDGRKRLSDDRARFILSKSRGGASLPYIPMRFDSQRSGLKGQYYDFLGEDAVAAGRLASGPVYSHRGDSILPLREQRDPFAGVRY
jgi:hypothetical protein